MDGNDYMTPSYTPSYTPSQSPRPPSHPQPQPQPPAAPLPPPPPVMPDQPQMTNGSGGGGGYGSSPPTRKAAYAGSEYKGQETFVSGGVPGADIDPGYFEKMGMKRKELMRFVCLGLMVTLGISVHWITCFYLDNWIEVSGFEGKQEFLIRLLYPAGIAFAIWNIKALWS